RGEARIPATAAATAGDDDAVVRAREVVDFLSSLVVVDDRAYRNFQQDVHTLAAGAVGAFAVASALRFVLRIEAEVYQRIMPLAGFHDDVAALTAVTTRGTATRDEFLPAEGHTAIAAVASFDPDSCLVDEHQLSVFGRRSSAGPRTRGDRPLGCPGRAELG